LNGVEDRGENGFGVREHIGIPEAKDRESLSPEPAIPHGIAYPVHWLSVLAAVEFDDDSWGVRNEVDNVRADRRLTTKLHPCGLAAAEAAPQCDLRIGGALAK
jgi:hypothetical protein